jgi:hypothetical protein
MSTDPAILQAFKEAATLANGIEQARRIGTPKLKDLSGRIVVAMEAGETATINLCAKALDIEIGQLQTLLSKIDRATQSLADVQKDDAFVGQQFAALARLSRSVDAARAETTRQVDDARKLHKLAIAAAQRSSQGAARAQRACAELDQWVRERKKEIVEAFKRSEEINSASFRAMEQRDTRQLADAKKAIEAMDIPALLGFPKALEQRVADFLREHVGQGLGEEVDRGFVLDSREFLVAKVAVDIYLGEMKRTRERILGFALAPVDVKKAARALAIGPGDEPRLAKALDGSINFIEKALDGLARELKLRVNGRMMLVELRRARLI